MAIANPLVLDYNAISKSLVLINKDNYGAEYFLREATESFRVRIRNTKESPGKDGVAYDRHNVEFTHVVFSTTVGVPDLTEQIYFVLRNTSSDPAATVAKLGDMCVAFMTNTHFQDLTNWQS